MTEPGLDPDGIAQKEMDHFGNCPVCGALIDMRDLDQVLAHTHGAAIEVASGDEPPPRDEPLPETQKNPGGPSFPSPPERMLM
jgi:hypothetical protein